MAFLRPSPLIVAFFGVACAASLRAEQMHVGAPSVAAATVITGYKSWTKVNPKPHDVSAFLTSRCSGPTPQEVLMYRTNPHIDQWPNAPFARTKLVTVYVNDTAKDAMLNQAAPVFPEGSIIVKEKLAYADSRSPELLTVMRKREKGFSSTAGDWEYDVVTGDGAKIIAEGKLKNCDSCHAHYKSTDFAARTYLSSDLLRSLK